MDLDFPYSLNELNMNGRESISAVIQSRLELLGEEGLATPSTLLKCKLDMFYKSDTEMHSFEDMLARSGLDDEAGDGIASVAKLLDIALSAHLASLNCKGPLSIETGKCELLIEFLKVKLKSIKSK